MTVHVVTGTSIQAAIDAAAVGDTIDVRAGSYAGRLKVAKGIAIRGDGGVIIEGGTGDGSHTVNVDVAAKGVVLSGLDLRHGSFAVRFKGDCTGSLVENCSIPVVDWMYRGTGTAQTGGNALVFEKASGVEARYNKISKCRAPSSQYTVDGGPFEVYSAQRINIHHNEVWDCVNSGEFGKSPGDPDNADIRFEDNIFHGRANPVPTDDLKLLAHGILVRTLSNGSFQRNIFDQVDHWSLLFDIGGTYGSSGFSGITVKGNAFRLLPGSNRMVHVEAGIPLSAFAAFDANKVYTVSSSARVAEIGTTRYYPGDLAKFRVDTGWEKTSAWTVGPLPPITPPLPVDPCATVKAERDAALTALAVANGKVTALTVERDAATAKLAQAKTLAAQITTL